MKLICMKLKVLFYIVTKPARSRINIIFQFMTLFNQMF